MEKIPSKMENKYKIIELEKGDIFTHEGVKHFDKFYYFSPIILNFKRLQSEPTELIKLLLLENVTNKVYVRLDENLSIPLNDYKPNFRLSHEVYWGKELNLDSIEFPYHAENKVLTVYNPNTMKKIQFKLSSRKDKEKWIEVEELCSFKDKACINTSKYLHSIFSPSNETFEHIDRSINFYSKESYTIRLDTIINAHSDSHEKLWLIEGKITKETWIKLVYRFFDDIELISDAFKGEMNEEVLEEILI